VSTGAETPPHSSWVISYPEIAPTYRHQGTGLLDPYIFPVISHLLRAVNNNHWYGAFGTSPERKGPGFIAYPYQYVCVILFGHSSAKRTKILFLCPNDFVVNNVSAPVLR